MHSFHPYRGRSYPRLILHGKLFWGYLLSSIYYVVGSSDTLINLFYIIIMIFYKLEIFVSERLTDEQTNKYRNTPLAAGHSATVIFVRKTTHQRHQLVILTKTVCS